MTTTTEDWTLVNQVYSEPSPIADNHRREVLRAVLVCARRHGGEVHAAWIRPLLPAGVNEHLIGNVMSQLSRAAILVETGRDLPSGDLANRNRKRKLPVRRVADWARLIEEVTR